MPAFRMTMSARCPSTCISLVDLGNAEEVALGIRDVTRNSARPSRCPATFPVPWVPTRHRSGPDRVRTGRYAAEFPPAPLDGGCPGCRHRARSGPGARGRRSPSSGFIVPTRMKRAGWEKGMPSRSTTFTPIAAESSNRSTTWSSRRFTSSTYSNPRLAAANTPGSKWRSPFLMASSMSRVPTTRSSVALTGRSTTARAPACDGQRFAAPRHSLVAVIALPVGTMRMAPKWAVRDHLDLGK